MRQVTLVRVQHVDGVMWDSVRRGETKRGGALLKKGGSIIYVGGG